MAYTPQYDYDIYISYVDADNQFHLLHIEGWIDKFCQALESELSKRIGQSGVVKIWSASRLDLSRFGSQAALKSSAVFKRLPEMLKRIEALEKGKMGS